MSLVALITDFGTKDGFVGAMKGVMLSINPKIDIVDVTHEVEPFNIFEGALILKAHYKYFAKGTIFVCVVDPGVGSERLPIALECNGYYFVGPHNGIFDLALQDIDRDVKAYRIENLTLPRINKTFHGRDIFAPVAAYISRGVTLEEVGRAFEYGYFLKWEKPVLRGDTLMGSVIYFDRFGNAITNIPCGSYLEGSIRNRKLPIVSHFLEQRGKEPAMLCGSFGLMEVFVPMDSAKELLKLKLNEPVLVKF
ncbi:MAG: S-adenosyl-l-methionine hydroxide adenosyltransferase family protein [Aquificaceae bacterium]